MTIREYIIEREMDVTLARLEALINMGGCPKVMLDGIGKQIEDFQKGIIKVGGDNNLLDLVFETKEVKKGRGGRMYIEFDNGVKYFPHARYGRFITK